jgi:hypothetical protein
MKLGRIFAAALAFVAFSGAAEAQDASIRFRCQGSSATGSQVEPFAVEIKNRAVEVSGLEKFETRLPLIQQDARFYVFKNGNKTQGGNIDRSNGAINLYIVNLSAHKITTSITGLCTKEE